MVRRDHKPLFMMMVGLPASGKSELALKLSSEYNAEIMSSDSVRIELFGKDYKYNRDDNHKVFSTLHSKLENALKSGKNVIYDATNIKVKTRISFLNKINGIDCTKVCYYIATPFMTCLEHNCCRACGYVNDKDVKDMFYNLEIPYYYEGWDNIRIVWNDRPSHSVRSLFKDPTSGLCNHTVSCQNQKYNLGEMMIKAHDLANTEGMPKDVALAALFCEIGYPYMNKFFTEPEYRYWNRMSAQDSIMYTCISYLGPLRLVSDTRRVQKLCLDVAVLIQWRDFVEQNDPAGCAKLFKIFKNYKDGKLLGKLAMLKDITDKYKQ